MDHLVYLQVECLLAYASAQLRDKGLVEAESLRPIGEVKQRKKRMQSQKI